MGGPAPRVSRLQTWFAACAVAALSVACTAVVDTTDAEAGDDRFSFDWQLTSGDGSGSPGPGGTGADPDAGPVEPPPDPACVPNPCSLLNRVCDDGACVGCLSGYEEVDSFCVPAGDKCDPDPCAIVNKVCVNGFCGGCLPDHIDDGSGNCIEPSPCFPNPCLEPVKTWCKVDDHGLAWCACDPGAHDDGDGNCTFDPCLPNPCEAPLTRCTPLGPFPQCGCPAGTLEQDGVCVDDPCLPNPCTAYAQTICTLDEALQVVCGCDPGFEPADDGGCVEAPVQNALALPEPEGDVELDDARQMFADDWLVDARPGMVRRLHPTVRLDQGWVLEPDEVADIGRARANGSLVHVPDAAELDPGPLAGWPWRLYYMGYRQLFTLDFTEPAWLCIAVAESPEGPWERPVLSDDPDDPAPHCVLRDDGLVQAEVTRTDDGWVMSATRLALGDAPSAGLYLYTSPDGSTWEPGVGGEPLVGISGVAVSPGSYARIGVASRLVQDARDDRWLGLWALTSPSLGDARGLQVGGSEPEAAWTLAPDPLTAPAILGPTHNDLTAGRVYGDMTAWRVGSLWLGLVHRRQLDCPKKGHAVLAASRDGEHWIQVLDEVVPNDDTIIPAAFANGQPDSHIATLSGGAPAEVDGLWHFFVGGTTLGPCSDQPAPGGIVRMAVRAGGLAGLQASGGSGNSVTTRPLRMAAGHVGSVLRVDAFVEKKLSVSVEALDHNGIVTAAQAGVFGGGDHRDEALAIVPLNLLTADRFRLRFTFTGGGGGELFSFSLSDPLCEGDPCAEVPGKTTCDSSSGEALCACDPPTHDDGEGGCTTDPCLPDPCTAPHELGCTAVDDAAVCGCEEGWVKGPTDVCQPDPCIPDEGEAAPCPPPGPSHCQALDGLAQCYCPEGSVPGPTGCLEIDPRAFVTSLAVNAANLGGVDGGDQLCNSLASAGELPGEYGAWLSAPGDGAGDRFVGGGPWRTWDPAEALWVQLVAWDLADLTDGTLASPIAWSEFGADPDDKCLVWTGTTASGHPAADEVSSGACDAWSSIDPPGYGLAGLCSASDASWTEWAPALCDKALRIYCLQLPEAANP